MMMMMVATMIGHVLAVLLLPSATAAEATRVAVVVQAVGLGADEIASLRTAAATEIEACGAMPVAVSADAQCTVNEACVAAVARDAQAAWIVVVDVQRAGGIVERTTQLLAADGKPAAAALVSEVRTEELGTAPLLDAAILERVRPVATPQRAPDAAANGRDDRTSLPSARASDSGAPVQRTLDGAPAPPPPASPPPPSALATAGVVGVVGGLGVSVLCGALSVPQFIVIRDPAAAGAAKEDAAYAASGLLIATGLGAVVAGAGAAVLFVVAPAP